MWEKFIAFYSKLPKEVKVFIEYILPSALLTAIVEYWSGVKINNVYLAAIINIILIFLRELKPRYDRMKEPVKES